MAQGFFKSAVAGITGPARDANAAVRDVSKSIKDLATGSGSTGSAMERLGGTFGDLVGEAAPADGVMGKITAALSELGPEGQAVAAVLTIVVGVVTELIQVLYSLASAAVAVSQEKDALAATFSALSEGATMAARSGTELVDAASNIAASLPQAEGAVLAWTRSLMAAGIQGAAMERGVRSIAAAAALMGREGGAAAEGLIKRFAMTAEIGGKMKLDRRLLTQMAAAGVSATALAQALGVPAEKLATLAVDASKLGNAFQTVLTAKGGKALDAMSITWGSIMGKLHDSWEDLFEDMGGAVTPFMTEVRDLFAEFFAGSTAMGPVKSILMSVLTDLFALATRVVHGIHIGFLQVQIAVLKVAIFLAPIVNLFREIYSNAMVLSGLKTLLMMIVSPLIVLIAVLTGVATVVVVVAAVVTAAFSAVVAAVSYAAGAVGEAIEWAVGALASLGTSAVETGAAFVSGLVAGITSGASMVVDAVTGLANSALGAFKGVLGIHSPSSVMRMQGAYVAQGAAQGIDAGAPEVSAAARAMGGGVVAGGAAGLRGGKGGGGSITVEAGAIVIQGAGKNAMEIGEEVLALLLERLAASQGLEPPT